jgi:hypothetical protein
MIVCKLIDVTHKSGNWQVIEAITNKMDVGDWWILYMLGRNLEPLVYREVVSELAKKVETNESNNAWLARPPVNSAGPYEELRAAVAEVADESSAV